MKRENFSKIFKGCRRACQRASSVTTILKTEQRATLTAALIISTFTLTNGPSALVEIYSRVFQIDFRRYYNIVMLSKYANFRFLELEELKVTKIGVKNRKWVFLINKSFQCACDFRQGLQLHSLLHELQTLP